jgi:hypothetical protein
MTKIIYLNQNKWIDLLKQQKGQVTEYEEELNAVKRLSETGEVIFPLSRYHSIETSSYRGGRESIDDMFRFMLDVSQAHCIAPYDIVKSEEIEQEARRLLGLDFRIDEKVISKGLPFMHAGRWSQITVDSNQDDSKLEKQLHEFSKSEEFAEKALFNSGYRSVLSDRNHEQEAASDLEKIREENSGKFKNNSHQRDVTTLYYHQEHIRPKVKRNVIELLLSEEMVSPLVDHGISEERLESKKYAIEYTKRFPASYTYTKLTVSRDLQRKIKSNDLNDIMALSVAIPCCDIIITENFWTSVANQCSLGNEYDSKIVSNLSEISGLQ